MGKVSRGYGFMVGLAAGFAVWGAMDWQPQAILPTSQEQTWESVGTTAQGQELESVWPAVQGQAEDGLKLYAQSAVLMDGDSGRVLYAKNADMFRPMASTTKIMTCILALEEGRLTDVCEASANAAAQPKVHLGVRKGDQFYLKDLLYSLMLESHNDTAVVIAEQIAGSREAFAEKMNRKARALGCMDTCFITPNGLDAQVTQEDGSTLIHGTTAENLARIMRYCVMESPKRELFLEITRTSNYSFTDVSGRKSYSCVNHNALLSMMEGALSGKTGFTGGAGYSYVGALEDDGRTYILALLGCGWPPHKTYKWDDARTLFSYGKENFHYREIDQKMELSPVLVKGGIPEQGGLSGEARVELQVSRTGEEPLRLLLSEEEQVVRKVELPDELTAPVRAGEAVGDISYYLNGEMVHQDIITAASDICKKDLPWFIKQIFMHFLQKVKNIT